MTCGVNVFIVLLELAIVYPECINTKTDIDRSKIFRIVLL